MIRMKQTGFPVCFCVQKKCAEACSYVKKNVHTVEYNQMQETNKDQIEFRLLRDITGWDRAREGVKENRLERILGEMKVKNIYLDRSQELERSIAGLHLQLQDWLDKEKEEKNEWI